MKGSIMFYDENSYLEDEYIDKVPEGDDVSLEILYGISPDRIGSTSFLVRGPDELAVEVTDAKLEPHELYIMCSSTSLKGGFIEPPPIPGVRISARVSAESLSPGFWEWDCFIDQSPRPVGSGCFVVGCPSTDEIDVLAKWGVWFPDEDPE